MFIPPVVERSPMLEEYRAVLGIDSKKPWTTCMDCRFAAGSTIGAKGFPYGKCTNPASTHHVKIGWYTIEDIISLDQEACDSFAWRELRLFPIFTIPVVCKKCGKELPVNVEGEVLHDCNTFKCNHAFVIAYDEEGPYIEIFSKAA